MSEHIRYAVDDRVATITIDRPGRRNAMTFAMNRSFDEAIGEAGNDPAVHVVIVTGAGGAFCAGTDLSDLDERTPEGRFGDSDRQPTDQQFWPLAHCPKPVIAAIDGPAVGVLRVVEPGKTRAQVHRALNASRIVTQRPAPSTKRRDHEPGSEKTILQPRVRSRCPA